MEGNDVTDDDAGAADDRVLTFQGGIPGFAQAEHWALVDLTEDGVFQQLTCLEDPELALVVMFPWIAFPDYEPDLPDAELTNLGIDAPEDVALFCAVTVDGDQEQLFVNLRAPFVANSTTMVARQVVLDDEALPLRAPIQMGG